MNPLKFLFAICLMALIHSVYAEPADSLKMDDYAWVGFDAEGNVTIMYVEYSKVETNSRTGNIKITVHGQLDESAPLPESTVKFETWQQGYICDGDAWYFVYVLTPSGHVNIRCRNTPFTE